MRKLLSEMSLDLEKCPNYKTHESKVQVFSLMSEIVSESGFLIKSYIIIVFKKCGAFQSVFKKKLKNKKKVDFPL